MIDKSATETISQAAQTLLACGDDFALMKQAVDQMYKVFSEITGVTIQQLNQDKDIMLSTGKAIGIAGAAHCLLEMKRTAVFLRGINKAILHKQQEKKGSQLRILYAGTGPYGTLVIPLLLLYPAGEIKVDLLEINSASLDALQKVAETLAIDNCIGEIYNSDAAVFKISHSYDIVVSETMQACLKNEPQVSIMQNLIPQLLPETIFIPEEIIIDARLTNSKMEMDRLMYYEQEQPPFERYELGNLFTLSKKELNSIHSRKKIAIPENALAQFPILKLFTTVKVFDNEVLTENDSSITLPKQFFDFRRQNAAEVEFWYLQGEKPHIASTFIPEAITLYH